MPHQRALGRQAHQAGRSAGRDDERPGVILRLARSHHERAPLEIDRHDVPLDDLGAEPLRLGPHRGHQLGAHDPVAEPRVVLDGSREHELPASLEPFDHERAEVRPRGVDGGRQARGGGKRQAAKGGPAASFFLGDPVSTG